MSLTLVKRLWFIIRTRLSINVLPFPVTQKIWLFEHNNMGLIVTLNKAVKYCSLWIKSRSKTKQTLISIWSVNFMYNSPTYLPSFLLPYQFISQCLDWVYKVIFSKITEVDEGLLVGLPCSTKDHYWNLGDI